MVHLVRAPRLAAAAVLVAAALIDVPAQAGPAVSYSSWSTYEEAAPGAGAGSSHGASGEDAGLSVRGLVYAGGIEVAVQAVPDPDVPGDRSLEATFRVGSGEMAAGQTYEVGTPGADADATVTRGRSVCAYRVYFGSEARYVGSFTVHELAFDAAGKVTRFSATWNLSCQDVGGPPGYRGTIAVGASAPAAPVPAQPASVPAVTGLRANNVSTDGYTSATSVRWTVPPGASDVTVDMVASADSTKIPAILAKSPFFLYRGDGTTWADPYGVESMVTRTYRVVPRGPTGRLGPASYLTVSGSRFDVPGTQDVVVYGEKQAFTGRLTRAWGSDDEGHGTDDALSGPPLSGQLVLLCQQDYASYVAGACTEVDRTRTDARGRFTLVGTPLENSVYDVRLPATPTVLANETRVANTYVAPQTDLRVAKAQYLRKAAVRRGSVVHFSTSRARAGTRGVVQLQRFDGTTWRTVVTRQLPRGRGARVVLRYREKQRGPHRYRVVKPADARHVAGYSRVVRLRFR